MFIRTEATSEEHLLCVLLEKPLIAITKHSKVIFDFFFCCFEKEGKQDEEENERGRDRERWLQAANPKSLFEILSDLNQAVPNDHPTDGCQTQMPDKPPKHPERGSFNWGWSGGVSR